MSSPDAQDPSPETSPTSQPPTFGRVLVAVAAAPLGLLVAALGLASIALGRLDLTVWGWLWSLEALGLGLALVTIASSRASLTRLRVGSALGLALLVLARVAFFAGDERASILVLDRDGAVVSDARWVDRLFEERDASMVGSRLLAGLGLVPAREFPTLPGLLARSYARTEEDAPRLGTPVPATLLHLQRADAFDAIVVSPRGAPSELGVVFLHGYAGSFALQCLEVARVARDEGARTVCPATSFEGAWWQGDGEAITRASIAHLRAGGARRIVLVGLSNGGLGASRLARRLGHAIDGLVLLSGVSPGAPTPRVPTLVVQGDHDAMMRTAAVRGWARGHRRVHYVELSGTHFVLLEQRERIGEVLREAFARRRDPVGVTSRGDRVRSGSRPPRAAR